MEKGESKPISNSQGNLLPSRGARKRVSEKTPQGEQRRLDLTASQWWLVASVAKQF